jgi:hypothetical protein
LGPPLGRRRADCAVSRSHKSLEMLVHTTYGDDAKKTRVVVKYNDRRVAGAAMPPLRALPHVLGRSPEWCRLRDERVQRVAQYARE